MDLKSVHEIFNNRILRIPSYQRGYTWANDYIIANGDDIRKVKGQLKDLWDDLMNIPDGAWHYTGLLTLVKADKQYNWLPNHSQFAIVDGQQRITSILIALSVIIDKAEALNVQLEIRPGDEKFKYLIIEAATAKAFIFGYEKDNPSDKYFRKHILKMDEVEDDSKESVYTENLKNARTFFDEVIDNYIGETPLKLKDLYTKITTNLRFNEYILPPELDEYVVFETMNNRGKPLSELEKLKNRLMYLNSKLPLFYPDGTVPKENDNQVDLLTQQNQSLEKDINTSWITIYNALGANKSKSLSDEDFLKNHWITYFDKYNRSEAEAYSGYLFDEEFILQNIYSNIVNYETIHLYVKSLQRASIVWNKLNNPSFFSDDEVAFKEAILSLYRAGFKPSFKPLVMGILLRDDKEEFIKVINLLEEYSFKIFDISNRQSNTGDSKLYKLAYQVYQNEWSADDTYNNIKQHLDWYYNFSFFKNQVIELFEYGNRKGYYGWSGRFYFLFEYDCYLRGNNSNSTLASKINWEDFYNKNSIEHILPQSAALSLEEYCEGEITEAKTNRYNVIQNDWISFNGFSPDERKRFCNSIGNLLAISSSDNSSFSNDPFLHKVDQQNKGEAYKNRGYKYDSMSARLVANFTDWTPNNIVERGKLMLHYLWIKVHPGTPYNLTLEDELDLMGLQFLKEKETENNG
jgi:uncharacterized protein with ParB-like and HNH nuclease domain